MAGLGGVIFACLSLASASSNGNASLPSWCGDVNKYLNSPLGQLVHSGEAFVGSKLLDSRKFVGEFVGDGIKAAKTKTITQVIGERWKVAVDAAKSWFASEGAAAGDAAAGTAEGAAGTAEGVAAAEGAAAAEAGVVAAAGGEAAAAGTAAAGAGAAAVAAPVIAVAAGVAIVTVGAQLAVEHFVLPEYCSGTTRRRLQEDAQRCCEERCRLRYPGEVSNQCACAFGCIYGREGHGVELCDTRCDDDNECSCGAPGGYCHGVVADTCSACNAVDPLAQGRCQRDMACDVSSGGQAYVDQNYVDCECECESPCRTGLRLAGHCLGVVPPGQPAFQGNTAAGLQGLRSDSLQDFVAVRTVAIMSTVSTGFREGRLIAEPLAPPSSPGCLLYPKKEVRFCSDIGHSHLVSAAFQEPGLVQQRQRSVEVAWARVRKHEVLSRLVDADQVCKWSLMDGLCLEAFPPCDPLERTPCQMACRNLAGCGKKLLGLNFSIAMAQCKQLCTRVGGPAASPTTSPAASLTRSPAASQTASPAATLPGSPSASLTASPPTTCGQAYQQCGGKDWLGPFCCKAGCSCQRNGDYYFQCVPSNSSRTTCIGDADLQGLASIPGDLSTALPGLPVLPACLAMLVAGVVLMLMVQRAGLLLRRQRPWHPLMEEESAAN